MPDDNEPPSSGEKQTMIRFTRRRTGGLTLPTKTLDRFSAMDSTESEPAPGLQPQQQEPRRVDRDPAREYPPHLHPYQVSGEVHPRPPSGDQGSSSNSSGSGSESSSSSNKRRKLHSAARKKEPGKFPTALRSLATQSGSATAFADVAVSARAVPATAAAAPAPVTSTAGNSHGPTARTGQLGRASTSTSTSTQPHELLISRLRALETRRTELATWAKRAEDEFASLIGERRAAEQKLVWLRREEEATRAKLDWLPGELRVVEERRARAVGELVVNGERRAEVLGELEGLEGMAGIESGSGNGGERDVIVIDEEMVG
ncbi:predicted protein [Histoplasma capsulatum G186AR]|uniref:Uncharacterized protein n=1 Tax=Ajellomyces capsulatus (strain G186AR / H82 / ATCC MYA-2454 / RMSCC 2432) TaxID=447093 RepID=C0NX74_AJECG|nr:uncharacterized protein HCBG_08066 [Histoplasma capsulatum G186AR]EEH03940.1 predicted protein [Histoplasma capsulatum G186AR]